MPLTEFTMRPDMRRIKLEFPELWELMVTSEDAQEKMVKDLAKLDVAVANFIFTEVPLKGWFTIRPCLVH